MNATSQFTICNILTLYILVIFKISCILFLPFFFNILFLFLMDILHTTIPHMGIPLINIPLMNISLMDILHNYSIAILIDNSNTFLAFIFFYEEVDCNNLVQDLPLRNSLDNCCISDRNACVEHNSIDDTEANNLWYFPVFNQSIILINFIDK